MRTLYQDVRFALRAAFRTPVSTAVIILTLALGCGANTAIFSVINGALLRPLPYKDPGRLTRVMHWWDKFGVASLSAENFRDFRAQNRTFENMGAWLPGPPAVYRARGDARQVNALQASGSFFPTLGVPAQLGRWFGEEADRGAPPQVAVISHRLWVQDFAGDPGVLGQAIRVNGSSYQVVGVMPSSFQFWGADVWTPLRWQAFQGRGDHQLQAAGRLRSGVSLSQARGDLSRVADQLSLAYPATNKGWGAYVTPFANDNLGSTLPVLAVLQAAVLLILLIACTNVCSMLISAAKRREREVALRAALGASHVRLIRQFLTESLALALAGGMAGLLLALWATSAMEQLLPGALFQRAQVVVDWRVLLFSLGVSVAAGLIFGLAPAFQVSRGGLANSLREARASVGLGGHRMLRGLVVAQTAFALILLTCAGIAVQSFLRLVNVDTGFRKSHLLVFGIFPSPARYGSREQRIAYFDRVVERVRALPGVKAASASSAPPLALGSMWGFTRPDRPGETRDAYVNLVTPGYFQTAGIRLLRGRDFDRRDQATSSGVVIVNQNLARRFFSGEDALGKFLHLPFAAGNYQIVGIVADTRETGLTREPQPTMYYAHTQHTPRGVALLVNSEADPRGVIGSVQRAALAIDPESPPSAPATMEQFLDAGSSSPRLAALLMGLLGGLALVLAAVGVYGIMSTTTAQRKYEFGIRLALGAPRATILGMVMRQGIRQIAWGFALGLPGAYGLSKLLGHRQLGLSTDALVPTVALNLNEPRIFLLASAVLVAVGLAACFVPARRATQEDPLVALRSE